MEFPGGVGRIPGIQLNDTVVFTGIHVTRLVFAGICTATAYAPTQDQLQAEPWREDLYWQVDFTNMFPNFAENWYVRNLNPFRLGDLFREANPNIPLLHNGGITLNGLLIGHSHLRLNDQFAQYLLDSMQH